MERRETPGPPAAPPGFEPGTYGRWFETPLGRRVWADERGALLPLLGPLEGRRILDAGAGDGRLAVELAAAGARVVAVDASETMLREAGRRTVPEGGALLPVGGRLEALPFRAASFDLVVAMTVLCFVEDPSAALGELARVVRPGGRVVLGELGRWSAWAMLRRLRGVFGHPLWRRAHFWTPGELEELVLGAGLRPWERRAAVFYPPAAAAARLLEPLEGRLALGCRGWGAAFLAVAAVRPEDPGEPGREPKPGRGEKTRGGFDHG